MEYDPAINKERRHRRSPRHIIKRKIQVAVSTPHTLTHFMNVLIHLSCCNQMPQSGWFGLKTGELLFLKFWRLRSPGSRGQQTHVW